MGVATAAIGLVGTVAGIAQNNMAISANNRAIKLQQQANERAGKIRVMGIELQEQQLKQQTELEKQNILAQVQQAQAAFDMQTLQRRLSVAQQLSGVDAQLAQSVFEQVNEQYQLARAAFDQEQQLSGVRVQELNQAAQELNQLDDQNYQMLAAVKKGDMNLAELIGRNLGSAYGSAGATESLSRQQDYEILRNSLDSEQYQAQLQDNLDASEEYLGFISSAIQRSLARNQQAARLKGEGTRIAAEGTRSSLNEYNKSSGRVETLSKALLPNIQEAGLLQADINYGYSSEALQNAKLESRFGTASQNAALEANKQRRNVIGDIASVALATIPLVQRISYYRQQQAPISGLNVRLDQPILSPPYSGIISDYPSIPRTMA